MILARLKQETQPQHEAVERRLGLFDHPPTRDSYRTLLRRFYGFHEPVEARIGGLADWSQLGFDFDRRRKAALLEQDLQALGDTRATLDALPRCPDLPDLSSVPRALGCLYVLEGSTLGGQYITRHLGKLPGGPFPTAFFASYGDEVGAMWKAFGAFLTAYSQARADDDVIVASARDTFAALGAWLPAVGETA
ncbi:biliverdin-producing heme oxygenase [Fimbriiglobus ruber]|uniref:Bacteriophytochrome heme oxygenase BphO n=1 Tax=Fimbriiglobus ruber TaxID=1908690 RepID=A0A225DCH6_9BACT|nr:biliverdin-producing heme oxygenase [Fimbriiglobus ruber]OWK38693.1 bacteriophytochrome heme oxygenase BphO [Fimbriiglobus ruber]